MKLQNETEAVLLDDADNALNFINRKAMLYNISITCPLIITFIANCYMEPARLFVAGNHKKNKVRYNTRRTNSNGSLCSRCHSFNSFSKLIHFYQRTQKQRNSNGWRFYSCRESKRDQSILRYTAATRVFVCPLSHTIQIIFDCERTAI